MDRFVNSRHVRMNRFLLFLKTAAQYAVLRSRVGSIHCFSLYSPFVSFVFLAALMTVWPNYSGILPTLLRRQQTSIRGQCR